jgi:hypothetical protein
MRRKTAGSVTIDDIPSFTEAAAKGLIFGFEHVESSQAEPQRS